MKYWEPFRKILWFIFTSTFLKVMVSMIALLQFGWIIPLMAFFIGFTVLDAHLENKGVYENIEYPRVERDTMLRYNP